MLLAELLVLHLQLADPLATSLELLDLLRKYVFVPFEVFSALFQLRTQRRDLLGQVWHQIRPAQQAGNGFVQAAAQSGRRAGGKHGGGADLTLVLQLLQRGNDCLADVNEVPGGPAVLWRVASGGLQMPDVLSQRVLDLAQHTHRASQRALRALELLAQLAHQCVLLRREALSLAEFPRRGDARMGVVVRQLGLHLGDLRAQRHDHRGLHLGLELAPVAARHRHEAHGHVGRELVLHCACTVGVL